MTQVTRTPPAPAPAPDPAPASAPAVAPTRDTPPADLLARLEQALAVRQEAVRAIERLLAEPHNAAELARARRRVAGLAAASQELLARFERACGVRPASPR